MILRGSRILNYQSLNDRRLPHDGPLGRRMIWQVLPQPCSWVVFYQ